MNKLIIILLVLSGCQQSKSESDLDSLRKQTFYLRVYRMLYECTDKVTKDAEILKHIKDTVSFLPEKERKSFVKYLIDGYVVECLENKMEKNEQ